jgi:DNA-binding Lrp family transcriptional regulator
VIAALPARLDAIDWAILRELQADGSITNVELARARDGARGPTGRIGRAA